MKNCTDFGGLPEDQIHCSIVSVESGGTYTLNEPATWNLVLKPAGI